MQLHASVYSVKLDQSLDTGKASEAPGKGSRFNASKHILWRI